MNKMIIDNKINNSLFSQSTDKKSAWTSQKGLSTKRSRQRKISISPAFQSLNSKWSSAVLIMILSMIHVTMATTAVPKYEDYIFITKTDLETLVKDSTGQQFEELDRMLMDCKECRRAEDGFTFTLKSPQHGNYFPDDQIHKTLSWRYYIKATFYAGVNQTGLELIRSKGNLPLATAISKSGSWEWKIAPQKCTTKRIQCCLERDVSDASLYKRYIFGVDLEKIEQLSEKEFHFTDDMAAQIDRVWNRKRHGDALERITNHKFASPTIKMGYNTGSITWETSLHRTLSWNRNKEFVMIRVEYQAPKAPKFSLLYKNGDDSDDTEEVTLAISNATLRNAEDKTIVATPFLGDLSKKDMESFLLALTPKKWTPTIRVQGKDIAFADRRRLLMRLAEM